MSGAVPAKIAAAFTLGELAVLSVIAREVQRRDGTCALPHMRRSPPRRALILPPASRTNSEATTGAARALKSGPPATRLPARPLASGPAQALRSLWATSGRGVRPVPARSRALAATLQPLHEALRSSSLRRRGAAPCHPLLMCCINRRVLRHDARLDSVSPETPETVPSYRPGFARPRPSSRIARRAWTPARGSTSICRPVPPLQEGSASSLQGVSRIAARDGARSWLTPG